MPKPSVRRVLGWVGVGALAIFLAIQLVPYGWRHCDHDREEESGDDG